MDRSPWVSFCISTYKRSEFLKNQLVSLSRQTFKDFEVVISDNDPDASAREVVKSFNDPRFTYFPNGSNLGMVKSFNNSIDIASTPYIVMVTDDDPVKEDLLSDFYELHNNYRGYSIYCGFLRRYKKAGEIEIICKERFAMEILDPSKTINLLWSSCIIKREDALAVGKIPDYGSPHLADHAFLAMVGSLNGGIIINRLYSSLTFHDTNFSKFNFDYYTKGCKGFYETLIKFFEKNKQFYKQQRIIVKHLGVWLIASIFTLKRYYSVRNYDPIKLKEVDSYADRILSLHYMKKFKLKVYFKDFIFQIKKRLFLLKYFFLG